MPLVTLQTIFQDAFPAYEHTHPLPAHVRKAARAIMQCRTAALGGHVQACPDGHMARIWYNGFVANCAQEVVKGQLPLSVEEIRRPGSRTVRPQ